jgi:predicted nucleic-acid-binding Zn-ribbon protein
MQTQNNNSVQDQSGNSHNHLLAEVYVNVLNVFTGKDELRPWIEKPFFIDNLAIATDCHQLIFFDKKLVAIELPLCENQNPQLILNNIPEQRNCNFKLNIDEIENCFKTAPITDVLKTVGEDIKCSECGGDGEVEWEYESWTKDFECPKCDGDGYESESRQIPTGEKELDKTSLVDVKNSRFSIKMIERLLKVKNLLSETEITLVFQEGENMANVFRIGKVEILCMPMRKWDNDDLVVLNLR